MTNKLKKALTASEINPNRFFYLKTDEVKLFDSMKTFTLSCLDGFQYDNICVTPYERYSCIRVPKFFTDHPWLRENDVVVFEIDNEKCLVNLRFEVSSASSQDFSTTKELTPAFERDIRDFLEINIIKHKFDSLQLYKGRMGKEFDTQEVGKIDLLCVDNNGDFVVIEIKKEKESDKVVGQIQRYMGWVKKNLAKDKRVRGIIILHEQEDDYENDKQVSYLRYALLVNPDIQLKFYKMSISLLNG